MWRPVSHRRTPSLLKCIERVFSFFKASRLTKTATGSKGYTMPCTVRSGVDTAQKTMFPIKDFFSKCDQIRRKLLPNPNRQGHIY